MPFTNVKRPPKPKQSLLPAPPLEPIIIRIDATEHPDFAIVDPEKWRELRLRIYRDVARRVAELGLEVQPSEDEP